MRLSDNQHEWLEKLALAMINADSSREPKCIKLSAGVFLSIKTGVEDLETTIEFSSLCLRDEQLVNGAILQARKAWFKNWIDPPVLVADHTLTEHLEIEYKVLV